MPRVNEYYERTASLTHHTSHTKKYEEIKPLGWMGGTFHWCWLSKSPLWGDTRLPPTRSCAQEDWEDVGGDDDDAGGNQ